MAPRLLQDLGERHGQNPYLLHLLPIMAIILSDPHGCVSWRALCQAKISRQMAQDCAGLTGDATSSNAVDRY